MCALMTEKWCSSSKRSCVAAAAAPASFLHPLPSCERAWEPWCFFSPPVKDGVGLTLASLRPGGATFWYARTDATERVRFRGRWASGRMLGTYIHEVNARSVMPALHPEARQKLQRFASAAPALLAAATQLLGQAPDAS